jgi:AraC-like DNA-binding protein
MFDLIGSGCIMGAGLWLLWRRKAENRRRSETLTDLITALRNMAEGVRLARVPLPELLDRIMAYVETNYASNIVIRNVAKEFYVSDSTVSHLFKQKLGISFYHFVTQRRLIAAKKLIEKDVPLETVAVQVGFQDYSGFYRTFRKEYGISPRQYRNLQN